MSEPSRYQPPSRLRGIAPSQIRDNMRIAREVGAINLAQGRPDFPTAPQVKQAAIDAIVADHNQYSVTWGIEPLRRAIAVMLQERFGLDLDPESDVTITCGVTEAVVAALLALVEPGEEVVIVEPAHENYVPAVAFAGGVPKFVTLRPPGYALPIDELEKVVGKRTKALILNTPHNPSGHVFTRDELEAVRRICDRHGVYLITDEIYDRLLYPGFEHVAPASLDGDPERVITTGGISKIYAATGWRLGYVAAAPAVSAAIRTVHDYLTICAPTPFQHAALTALALPSSYYQQLVGDFVARRRKMMAILSEVGFVPYEPQGAYYLMATYDDWDVSDGSAAFTRWLITEAGVATVPGSAFFYRDRELGERLVRFAFAKSLGVLDEVGARLKKGLQERQAQAR